LALSILGEKEINSVKNNAMSEPEASLGLFRNFFSFTRKEMLTALIFVCICIKTNARK